MSKRRPDWAVRLAKLLREDFVERQIEGRPIHPDMRELYLSLTEAARDEGYEADPLPDFLKGDADPR